MTTKIHYAPGAPTAHEVALSWRGKRFSAGWCLYFVLVKILKVPGLGDYDHDGAADAEDYWKAAVARGKVVHAKDIKKYTDIPAGVVLMWTGGSHDNGHAAFAMGKGLMVSTDLPKSGVVDEVKIDLPHTKWGLTFVGYVLVDGNGFTLIQPPKKAAKPKPAVYKVTAKAGLKAHVAPTLTSKVDHVAPLGTKITEVKTVVTGHRHFVVDAKKHYYAKEYLEKV